MEIGFLHKFKSVSESWLQGPDDDHSDISISYTNTCTIIREDGSSGKADRLRGSRDQHRFGVEAWKRGDWHIIPLLAWSLVSTSTVKEEASSASSKTTLLACGVTAHFLSHCNPNPNSGLAFLPSRGILPKRPFFEKDRKRLKALASNTLSSKTSSRLPSTFLNFQLVQNGSPRHYSRSFIYERLPSILFTGLDGARTSEIHIHCWPSWKRQGWSRT